MFAHHGTAASAGAYDVVIAGEYFDHAPSQRAGFVEEAVVVEGLAATGLLAGEFDAAAELFEDFGDGYADQGIKLVVETSDEQSDPGIFGRRDA